MEDLEKNDTKIDLEEIKSSIKNAWGITYLPESKENSALILSSEKMCEHSIEFSDRSGFYTKSMECDCNTPDYLM